MKTDEKHQKSLKTALLAEIGRILMKSCPSDAEFNFRSTGTNENSTTTKKSIKTEETKKTKQKTKTDPKKQLNIV